MTDKNEDRWQSGSGLPGGRDFGALGYLFIAGFEIAAPVVLGVYLDGQLHWSPWCTIVGAVVGLVGGTFHLYRMANRANRPGGPGSAEGSA